MNVPVLPGLQSALDHARVSEKEWVDRLVRMGFRLRPCQDKCGLGTTVECEHFFVTVSGNVGGGVSLMAFARAESQAEQVGTMAGFYSDTEGLDQFLEALLQPDLLPTCVGMDWAGNLLEWWLRRM